VIESCDNILLYYSTKFVNISNFIVCTCKKSVIVCNLMSFIVRLVTYTTGYNFFLIIFFFVLAGPYRWRDIRIGRISFFFLNINKFLIDECINML
jgi:hypothetical protein